MPVNLAMLVFSHSSSFFLRVVAPRLTIISLRLSFNKMIVNLAATTRKNNEQDWLKTNIAKFTGMMQGQRDLLTVSQLLLSELTPLVGAQHGTFYIADAEEDKAVLNLLAGYAIDERDGVPTQFEVGQGLVGQCAREKEIGRAHV